MIINIRVGKLDVMMEVMVHYIWKEKIAEEREYISGSRNEKTEKRKNGESVVRPARAIWNFNLSPNTP
jgi:hypothetical protein